MENSYLIKRAFHLLGIHYYDYLLSTAIPHLSYIHLNRYFLFNNNQMQYNFYLSLLILFIIAPQICFSQSIIIKGQITSDNSPIPFAIVGVEGTTNGTSSDIDGKYSLSIDVPGRYIISVSSVGYTTLSKEVTITIDDTLRLDFDLVETSALLDQIVISGTLRESSKSESPVPIEVYTAKFFLANPTPSIFESMQNVNGVRPQLNCNICNTGDIHINGLEGPYTMVLIDGMPIVSGLSTVYGLTGIPQSLVDRVEIVKGPASTLYGSEAVGGLINIITKNPTKAPLLSVDVMGTGWQEFNLDIGHKMDLKPNITSLIGVNFFNYQNPIDNNLDGFTDITLQRRYSLFNKWNIQRKNNRLFTLAGRYVYEDRWGGDMRWNNSFRGGDEIYGESIFTKRWEFMGSYALPYIDNMLLQVSANGHDQNSVYGTTAYVAQQYIGFSQLTWFAKAKKHDILLGAAYRYTYYDDNTPATAHNDSTKTNPSIISLPSVFFQDEYNVSNRQKLLLGLRFDYNSIHGQVWTPRLNYKISSNDRLTHWRLSLGNGYRVANVFTEDHAALTGARIVEFKGDLQPETSWNVNLNFEKKIITFNNTLINIDVTGFYTYFTNRILPDYETDVNKIIYDNLDGYSLSRGMSSTIQANFINGFKFNLGTTLQDVRIIENNSAQRQILTEGFSGVWQISYTWSQHDLTIDYTGNIYGPMRLPLLGALDNRPEYSPTWSTQNIQITKTINKKYTIYCGIKNILNYTPPANSIARAFDPFDKNVLFDTNGSVIPTPENPNALTFDPSYVFAPMQGLRVFLGFRFSLDNK